MENEKSCSVLIVEDERIVAKDLQQTLIGLGYDAFAVASSSEEALAYAMEKSPDVVLMDVRIKGLRVGVEMAEIMRRDFVAPVVYMTAHADEATIERAKRTAPHGYLLKPVKTAELRNAMEVARYKRKIEARLKQSDLWFAAVLRSVHDAVVTSD